MSWTVNYHGWFCHYLNIWSDIKTFYRRSVVPNDVPNKFLVTWNGRCDSSNIFPMCHFNVLALCLSRIKTGIFLLVKLYLIGHIFYPWCLMNKMTFCLDSQNERRMITFYLPKIIVVGSLWGAALILATWLRWSELEDPTYNYVLDTSNYYVSKTEWRRLFNECW